MPNLIDQAIGYLNPMAGVRRHIAREVLARAYEGASKKDGWNPRRPGASANTDHQMDSSALRIRARSLVQNVPYIAQGLSSLVANVIGTGLVPRSLASNAAAIDKLWNQWTQVADADGRFDLYGLQAAAYRAMEQDGECLIRLRPRRPEDRLPVPLQIQLLEIDWLDSSKNATIKGNIITNGIEYDSLGTVVAYWLYDQHPGETGNIRTARTQSRPVPAANIIHFYNPARPGQGRGITRLAPVIARVRDLSVYEDAEMARKNLETRLAVIASGDPSKMGSFNPEDARTEAEIRKDGNLGSLSGGNIIQVPSGLNMEVVQPNIAPGYVDYVKHQLHLIAAGMGITYEMLTGDVKEVNFSSARVALLEFRRNAEQLQWLCIIPRLCNPLWSAFLEAASLSGKLDRPNPACDWSTPKWDYVNPEQDVKADLAEISGGLSTISEKLRRRGYKPDMVFAELKSDFDRLRSDGTLDLLLMLQAKQAPQTPAASAPAIPNLKRP
jgi:lambda family phage portal protein